MGPNAHLSSETLADILDLPDEILKQLSLKSMINTTGASGGGGDLH